MPYILKAEQLETQANKVQIINESSTDEQYPSAKAVKDAIANIESDITIDQEYTAESENPQSGKAVAQAVNTIIESTNKQLQTVTLKKALTTNTPCTEIRADLINEIDLDKYKYNTVVTAAGLKFIDNVSPIFTQIKTNYIEGTSWQNLLIHDEYSLFNNDKNRYTRSKVETPVDGVVFGESNKYSVASSRKDIGGQMPNSSIIGGLDYSSENGISDTRLKLADAQPCTIPDTHSKIATKNDPNVYTYCLDTNTPSGINLKFKSNLYYDPYRININFGAFNDGFKLHFSNIEWCHEDIVIYFSNGGGSLVTNDNYTKLKSGVPFLVLHELGGLCFEYLKNDSFDFTDNESYTVLPFSEELSNALWAAQAFDLTIKPGTDANYVVILESAGQTFKGYIPQQLFNQASKRPVDKTLFGICGISPNTGDRHTSFNFNGITNLTTGKYYACTIKDKVHNKAYDSNNPDNPYGLRNDCIEFTDIYNTGVHMEFGPDSKYYPYRYTKNVGGISREGLKLKFANYNYFLPEDLPEALLGASIIAEFIDPPFQSDYIYGEIIDSQLHITTQMVSESIGDIQIAKAYDLKPGVPYKIVVDGTLGDASIMVEAAGGLYQEVNQNTDLVFNSTTQASEVNFYLHGMTSNTTYNIRTITLSDNSYTREYAGKLAICLSGYTQIINSDGTIKANDEATKIRAGVPFLLLDSIEGSLSLAHGIDNKFNYAIDKLLMQNNMLKIGEYISAAPFDIILRDYDENNYSVQIKFNGDYNTETEEVQFSKSYIYMNQYHPKHDTLYLTIGGVDFGELTDVNYSWSIDFLGTENSKQGYFAPNSQMDIIAKYSTKNIK